MQNVPKAYSQHFFYKYNTCECIYFKRQLKYKRQIYELFYSNVCNITQMYIFQSYRTTLHETWRHTLQQ
jgi:hypothetical protein